MGWMTNSKNPMWDFFTMLITFPLWAPFALYLSYKQDKEEKEWEDKHKDSESGT